MEDLITDPRFLVWFDERCENFDSDFKMIAYEAYMLGKVNALEDIVVKSQQKLLEETGYDRR